VVPRAGFDRDGNVAISNTMRNARKGGGSKTDAAIDVAVRANHVGAEFFEELPAEGKVGQLALFIERELVDSEVEFFGCLSEVGIGTCDEFDAVVVITKPLGFCKDAHFLSAPAVGGFSVNEEWLRHGDCAVFDISNGLRERLTKLPSNQLSRRGSLF